ncbi:phosphotransferase family protein [Pradoshia sp.]
MKQKLAKETIPVRAGEELHIERLEAYLRTRIEGLPNNKLEIEQFSAGHSNLTYQLRMGEWQAVLRKPPLGPVAPKAHDMEREFTILSDLSQVFDPAPKPMFFSDDLEVVGSPFFVMERKRGYVFDTEIPEGVTPSRELFQNLSKEMVKRLADLHQIPYEETKLAAMSKPDGFMERQTYGWIKRYEKARTHEVDAAEDVAKWLASHIPKRSDAAIIHYDYKLNNAMFTHDGMQMSGLFDWEMTTVGDPLADLGVALSYWTSKDDPEFLQKGLGKESITNREGFYSREKFLDEYARLSGRDVTDMKFYMVFAYFKLAGICQQIYYRYHRGQTQDERFKHLHVYVKGLIEHAAQVMRG